MSEDFVKEFLPRLELAHQAMGSGDPEPWLTHWSTNEPISLMGAFGYPATGQEAVRATIRTAVASRLAGFKLLGANLAAVDVSSDRAYIVAVEKWLGSLDENAQSRIEIRITEIYRLEDGQWHVAHRHGDFIRPEYGSR